MASCCHDPKNYKASPDPHKRHGWTSVSCKVCGKWLGCHDEAADNRAGQPRQTKTPS